MKESKKAKRNVKERKKWKKKRKKEDQNIRIKWNGEMERGNGKNMPLVQVEFPVNNFPSSRF